MMPNHRNVWNCPYELDGLHPVPADGRVKSPSYSWNSWDEPTHRERGKQSYGILCRAFARSKILETS